MPSSSTGVRNRRNNPTACNICGNMAHLVRGLPRCGHCHACISCAGPIGTGLSKPPMVRRNSSVSARKKAVLSGGKAPSSVTIRMYNVGFGDCFLLTFHYATKLRYMLIDYGSTAAPKGVRGGYMAEVAKDIKSRCNGKLDVLVETHRHRDHISGFTTNGVATGKIIASLEPDYVIQPWTEDPDAKPDAMTATT